MKFIQRFLGINQFSLCNFPCNVGQIADGIADTSYHKKGNHHEQQNLKSNHRNGCDHVGMVEFVDPGIEFFLWDQNTQNHSSLCKAVE